MFTGIVQAVGQVKRLRDTETGKRMDLDAGVLDMAPAKLGDSIAVNGVCLTLTAFESDGFSVDVSAETLRCTTLGGLAEGARVNLEPALTLSNLVGGHLVSGHVDTVGKVVEHQPQPDALRLAIEVPEQFGKYICYKGSICVDGVSLTVNAIDQARFELLLIPHTLRCTILSDYALGQRVNIEVDLIARYLERLLVAGVGPAVTPRRITREFLDQHGYLSADPQSFARQD